MEKQYLQVFIWIASFLAITVLLSAFCFLLSAFFKPLAGFKTTARVWGTVIIKRKAIRRKGTLRIASLLPTTHH